MTGPDARFAFRDSAEVSFSAPQTGIMAGLLFYEDPASAPDRHFYIESENVRYLLGTIYLPRGDLTVSATGTVADTSEFTIIVANRVDLDGNPNLVINTDYGGTKVPVPGGLGNARTDELQLIR